MRAGKPLFSLQTTITLLVCVVVSLSLLATDILISDKVAENTKNNLADKAMTIARTVARTPLIIEALSGKRNVKEIQDFSVKIQKATNVRFVVVIDMKGIRKSHPDPTKIGTHFSGGEGPALQGKEYTYVAKGPLGVTLRAFSPVYTPDGKQVGAVAVGLSLDYVHQVVQKSRWNIYIGIGFGFLIGVLGAFILAKKIKNTLFGLEPFAIAKLLEERSAVIQSVKEGVLVIDNDSVITLVNTEGKRLLKKAGIDGELIGKKVEEVIPNTGMGKVLQSGREEFDNELMINGVTLVTNRVPVSVKGRTVGAVSTFRDKTEIKLLAEQLTGVRLYAEALRAQAHEFMNKLHVILGMAHMKCYDELISYISKITNQQQEELGFVIKHIKDPVLAGFILGKMSYARELGAELVISKESNLPEPQEQEIIHELVTVIGNLIDNALEAVKECPDKNVQLSLLYNEGLLTIEVSDHGKGINDELKNQIFSRGFSTKAENRGLGLFLVQSSLKRLKGEIKLFSEEGWGTKFVVSVPYKGKGELN